MAQHLVGTVGGFSVRLCPLVRGSDPIKFSVQSLANRGGGFGPTVGLDTLEEGGVGRGVEAGVWV